MKNVAIIGLGHQHIFTMIEETLAEKDSLTIKAICDPNSPENVKKAAEMIPGVKIYDDMDELLAKEDIELVLSSSIFGHKSDIAVKSLKAGKHILIDKPLATTEEGLNEIEAELKKNPSLKATLWLTERYAPNYYTAKQLIDAGEIGEVVNMYFVRPHRLAPTTRPAWFFDEVLYGGILNDIGVHDLDMARWFTNSECKEIMASHVGTKRYTDYTLEDEGSSMFMMESGATGVIFENWLTPDKFPAHGDTRATVYGTKGQIEVKSWPESVTIFSDTKEPQEVPLVKPSVTSVQDFVLTIDDPNHKPLVSANDAIRATRFALDAQKKAK